MNTIFDLFVAVFSLKITYEYLNIFFEIKRKKWIYLIWLVYYLWQGILFFRLDLPEFSKLLITIILVFFIAVFSYNGKVFSKIVLVIMYNVIWMLSELIIGYIYMFLGSNISEMIGIGSLISKLFLWGIINAIKIFLPRQNLIDIKQFDIMLIIIPIGSIIVLNSIFSVSHYIDSEQWKFDSLVSTGVLLLINVIAFDGYKKSCKEWELKQKSIFYENQLKIFNNSISDKQKMFLEMRRLRHDLKHHLIYLLKLIEHGENNEALLYVEKLIDESIGKEKCNSENFIIDSLVNYKNKIATNNSIVFDFDIKVPINLPFEMADISVLLGNVLDNAIESCLNCECNRRKIYLKIRFDGENMFISLENSLNQNKIKKVNGKFVTTKINSANHGLGLYSIEKIVEKYHGYLLCESKEQHFFQKIILYSLK